MKIKKGEPISIELSNALLDHVTERDIDTISLKTGTSRFAICDLINRHLPITEEKSKESIILATKIALENCHRKSEKFIRQKEILTRKYFK